ncbi:MAG: zf-HC2 domain-containing protein [Elusimicrobia bacterium]|jgi:predicted anti-sigma-YlaC factor YlaD|nr:zf-HC2 domain-containing protein [Elusimicrobiota bacterium]MBP9698402.1 zf-HC2 domain-containing protein [Elusimicrobiota bacterium]
MNCREVQELLPAFIDAALEPEATIGVRTHLNACHICRQEESLLSSTWSALGALPSIQPSPEFRARFWERVRREEDESNKWWAVFLPKQLIPVAAGFLVIWTLGVAGGLFLFKGRASASKPLELAVSVFASPFPPNSIEQIYLQGTSDHSQNVRRQNS